MTDDIAPEVVLNRVLGKISDVLLNGDGDVIPRSDDHFLAFMSPGIPMLASDFAYASEGFGGVYRRNVDLDDLEASTGPQEGGEVEAELDDDVEGPSVEQLLAADARQKYMRAESFYNIVDLVPDVSGIVDSGRINHWNPEARISPPYPNALQQSQVYDNQPDDETRAKVDRWRSKLVTTTKKRDIVTDEEVEVTEPSELVKRYEAKMMDYLAAATEYNNLRINAMSGDNEQAVHQMAINGALLQMKVRAAMNAWSTIGHKGDYEALTAAIQSVEDRAFVLLKQRYKEDYARSIVTNPSSGSNFLYCAPASAAFADADSGWTRFTFDAGDIDSDYSHRSSSTSASGGLFIGGLGLAGGGGVDKERYEGSFDRRSFHLDFEMARVPISRPWLNLDYLMSGFWRFDEANEIVRNSMISDGGSPPDGLMPALTTDCIFIRDLHLRIGEYHSEFVRTQESKRGRGGFSFGPIHLGARHSSSEEKRSFESDWNNQEIRVEGMQMLGFMAFMLPQSPDPNPNITEWI